MSTDRAQSEVLGFAIVFGIVVVAIALLTTTGLGGLTHAQQAERTNNVATGFQVLARNVDDLVGGAPSRTTELSLSNGRLSSGAPVMVTIRGERVADPTQNFTHTVVLHPIVYADESDTRFVYAGGAVFREERRGTVAIERPAFRLSGDAVSVPLVRTGRSARSVGGSTVASVATRRTGVSLLERRADRYDVTVTVDSPRAAAWRDLLQAHDGVSCGPVAGDSVTCTVPTDRVTLAVVDVDVTLD